MAEPKLLADPREPVEPRQDEPRVLEPRVEAAGVFPLWFRPRVDPEGAGEGKGLLHRTQRLHVRYSQIKCKKLIFFIHMI